DRPDSIGIEAWKAVDNITRQCSAGCLGQRKASRLLLTWPRFPMCILFSPTSACPVFSNLSSPALSLCKLHVAMSPVWPRFLLTGKGFSTWLGFSVAAGAMLEKGHPKFPLSVKGNLFST
ncbi:hypothetical protein NXF25_020267, partial [Crotalus adamanteus]